MVEENKHNTFTEDGHLNENSIALCAEWLNGKIISIDKDILDHLQVCPQCKSDVLEISEIISRESSARKTIDISRDKFEETCAAKHSPSVMPSKKTNYWRVAAIFFVLASVTALTILLMPGKDGEDNNIARLDSAELTRDSALLTQPETAGLDTAGDSLEPVTIESVEEGKLAENFTPNPGFESLVGAKFRSGNVPLVINPPIDTVISRGAKLHFEGKNPSADILELEVLDNKGKLIWSSAETTDIDLLVDIDWLPGLYYWKLLGKEELFQVGRIRVRVNN